MSANPIPKLNLDTWRTGSETYEVKVVSLRERIEALLREMFDGHEEFLGWTPD